MIDNLLKEGGGILRRLPSAAMAIMLAVTLAIPQGLALADFVGQSGSTGHGVDRA